MIHLVSCLRLPFCVLKLSDKRAASLNVSGFLSFRKVLTS